MVVVEFVRVLCVCMCVVFGCVCIVLGMVLGMGLLLCVFGCVCVLCLWVWIVVCDVNFDLNLMCVLSDGDVMLMMIDWFVVDFDVDVGCVYWMCEWWWEMGVCVWRVFEAAAETRRAGRMATYDEFGDEEESMECMSVEFVVEVLIVSGMYDVDVRVGLRMWVMCVGESWRTFAEAEDGAAERMRRVVVLDDGSELESEEWVEGEWLWMWVVKIGGVVVIGGVALFVTGGVAASAVLASLSGLGVIGVVMMGVLVMLGGVGVVFGVMGVGLIGYVMLCWMLMEME